MQQQTRQRFLVALLRSAMIVLCSAEPMAGLVDLQAGMTVSPTAIPADATIIISSVAAHKGQQVSIDVRLETTGEVNGVWNEITFGPEILVPTTGEFDSPACMVNPAIGKPSTTFQLDCDAIGVCRLWAVVFSFGPVLPIPSGSVLYSCRIVVTDMAQNGASYGLICDECYGVDPDGARVPTTSVNGSVTVLDLPATLTSPTETPLPVATPTSTSSPPWGSPNDDGCQVAASRPSALLWLLVVPVLLHALRRVQQGSFAGVHPPPGLASNPPT
jgi:hypothetical protein